MGKFSELTKYIPMIENDPIVEWVTRTVEVPGEEPDTMTYADYSKMVIAYEKDVYNFCENHPEYEHTKYLKTLEGFKAREGDVSDKDAKFVIALLVFSVRGERFREGFELDLFKDGLITKWLKRLEELDSED